ncbi:hypothetical protein PISMIDRAFT_14068 [Pisolithus microcarpus 441]|uniref:Uncharacterized protein n=1 Tax=Pisolithus microcarpus 441 TaxID=765257 RepID=A0A0C9ZG37_9AGAM|nr:hypothetical protein PISMIDRAFT_14068 [Pisolithus microcarpus 441]
MCSIRLLLAVPGLPQGSRPGGAQVDQNGVISFPPFFSTSARRAIYPPSVSCVKRRTDGRNNHLRLQIKVNFALYRRQLSPLPGVLRRVPLSHFFQVIKSEDKDF